MKRSLAVLVLVAACSSHSDAPPAPAPTPSPPPPRPASQQPAADPFVQASALYDAKDYAGCATAFAAAADAAPAKRKELAFYNAACCHALAGKPDDAFALLERSVEAGLRDRGQLERDTDFTTLRADPRWAKLLAHVDALTAALEKSLKQPALRVELLALVEEDQRARNAMIEDGSQANLDAVKAIDTRTTARMKQVVAKHGWPGKSLVGEDGAHAAWLLVQHADADVAFQKDCLARIAALVASGEVDAIDHAYLEDRVAVAEHRKQRFGTQFNDKREPQPIEDEAHVDERRAAIGLPSLAQYKQDMLRRYGPPK